MSRPDEGLIHAWLDGELDAAEAARVEALVRSDPEWSAAAADARGFIAASARILGALDDVPANVVPRPATTNLNAAASPAGDGNGGTGSRTIPSGRSAKRGTPWWAMRAAAVLVVVAGTAVVLTRGRVPDVESDATASLPPRATEPPPQAALTETGKSQEPAAPASGVGKAPVAAPLQAKPMVSGATSAGAPGKGPAVSSLDKTSLANADAPRRKDAPAPTNPVAPAVPTPAVPQVATQSAKALADERIAATGGAAPPVAKATNEAAVRRAAPSVAAASADAASSLRQAAPRAAPAANAFRLEPVCFRQAPATSSDTAVIHRVVQTSDSTAIPMTSPDLKRDVAGFRAEAQATGPTPLAVRNDTLVLGVVDGRMRYAVRVSCPQP